MKCLLAIALLSLGSCCPHQDLRIEGSSDDGGISIYDPNTDIWYNIGGRPPHIVERIEHWNHHENLERCR